MEEGVPPGGGGAAPDGGEQPQPNLDAAALAPSPLDFATQGSDGAQEVIRAAVALLEQDEPNVEEALRVLRSGLQLLALASATNTPSGSPSALDAPSGPPADRYLIIRPFSCIAPGTPDAGLDSYLVFSHGGKSLQTEIILKSAEPRYEQVFAFPLHSEATERGDSENLRIELWSKNRLRGDTCVGAVTFDFGQLCSRPHGNDCAFQPLRSCKESPPPSWAADAAALPGSLQCAGQVRVPPIEWLESSRDFTRAFAATANGSGDMLLMGLADVKTGGTMQPIRSEMANSGNVNEEVTAAAVQEFRAIVEQALRASSAQISVADDSAALDKVCRSLIDNLTVTPAMQVLVDHDVMPAMYQNKFVVLTGTDSVRVATYGFIGPGAIGDRPDRKHTGFVIRLLSENLLAARDGGFTVSFSCKLTEAELIDEVMGADVGVITRAVSSGDYSEFGPRDALPESWVSDSWWRLENDQAYGNPSTALLRVGLSVQMPTPEMELTPGPCELVADQATQAQQLFDEMVAATYSETELGSTSVTAIQNHEGYAVPKFVTRQAWALIDAKLVRMQELAIAEWFEYLSRCPRIFPLPIGTDYVDNKEVSKPHVSADLRRLIIAGVPSQWACEQHELILHALMEMGAEHLGTLRSKLWLELTGAKDLKLGSKVTYRDMSDCTAPDATVQQWLSLGQASSGFTTMQKERKQVCKDVPRTGDMSEEETQQLQRVLLTFTLKFPSIGYCQSMNFVALALLRAMGSEENAFWLLGGICTNVLHGYYTQSMSRTQIDSQMLSALVEQKLPTIHTHLNELDCPLELMVSQWLLPIYVTAFPAVTAFAIWDWLFVDGSDILLMVALAFMSLHEEDMLRCCDFAEVTQMFTEKPPAIFSSGPLLQRARALYEELGTSKLSKLREAATMQVATSGEQNNKERMVRQMVKETHLSEADIEHLHERFMELEQQARARKIPSSSSSHPKTATADSSNPVQVQQNRGRRGSISKLKSGLKSFKKTDLQAVGPDTIYEDREIDFDTFKILIRSELPQWGRSSDDESLQQLFHAFDGDDSGTIGVSEFISGLSIFSAGDIDHKLRMIFRTTDADGSGHVEETEMLKLFQDCYRLFYPGMNQNNIPELVRGIFNRLEVDPVAGLNFEEFALVVKSQPLLLECFSLDALSARQENNTVSTDSRLAAQGLENRQGKLMVLDRKKWKEKWLVLSEGVLSFYTSEEALEKGTRLGRVDLRSNNVQVTLNPLGGGKSGKEEVLIVQWQEQGKELELKCTEPPSYSYDFQKGLRDAVELRKWNDCLQMYMQVADQGSDSVMEMGTLSQMPPNVLEQVLRFALMAWSHAQGGSTVLTVDDLSMAEDAVSMALTEELPTISQERHGAIKAAALQVIKTGGADSSILAMVRRGCAYEQVEELLNPLGFEKSKAKVFYNVVGEFVRKERASAFEIVEVRTEDGRVELQAKAKGTGLASVSIFSKLSDEIRDKVAQAFSTCTFQAGEKIFLEGDEGDAMYLILRGDVEVVKEASNGSDEKVVAVLGPGHCFGEMSLLSAEVRSASMRCRGASVCCVLTLDMFQQLVESYPALRESMVAVASERAAFSSRATSRALATLASNSSKAASTVALTTPQTPAVVASTPTETEPTPDPQPPTALTRVEAEKMVGDCAALELQLEDAVLDEDFAAVTRLNQELDSKANALAQAKATLSSAE
eukprot:COSAG05_NODE_576_length_8580_cov_190.797194_5_plen_1695_part_00